MSDLVLQHSLPLPQTVFQYTVHTMLKENTNQLFLTNVTVSKLTDNIDTSPPRISLTVLDVFGVRLMILGIKVIFVGLPRIGSILSKELLTMRTVTLLQFRSLLEPTDVSPTKTILTSGSLHLEPLAAGAVATQMIVELLRNGTSIAKTSFVMDLKLSVNPVNKCQ